LAILKGSDGVLILHFPISAIPMAEPFQALIWDGIDAEAPINDPTIARNHRQWSAGRPSNKADDYAELAHGRLHVLWIFGRNVEGASVAVKTPCPAYFFVDAPKNWAAKEEKLVGEELYRCIEYQYPGSLLSCEYVQRKRFFGYHGDRTFGFYKVEFVSTDALRMCSNVLRKRAINFKEKSFTHTFTVYESNVDPIIRFQHEHKLESTGWMKASGVEPVPAARKETSCTLEYHCRSGDQITPCPGNTVAPFVQVCVTGIYLS
jgi:hypothetical protein